MPSRGSEANSGVWADHVAGLLKDSTYLGARVGVRDALADDEVSKLAGVFSKECDNSGEVARISNIHRV